MGDAFDDWLIDKIQLLRKGPVIASGIQRIEQVRYHCYFACIYFGSIIVSSFQPIVEVYYFLFEQALLGFTAWFFLFFVLVCNDENEPVNVRLIHTHPFPMKKIVNWSLCYLLVSKITRINFFGYSKLLFSKPYLIEIIMFLYCESQ
jgi:hypothetical protein